MGSLKGWSKGKVKKKKEKEAKEPREKSQVGLINELLANVRAENDRLREACGLYKSALAIVLARMSEVRDMVGGDPEGIRLECQKVIDEVKGELVREHIADRKTGGES